MARPRRGGTLRDWFALIVRIGILILLSLSLAGTQVVRADDELAVVFLIDASDSINEQQADQAESFVRGVVESLGADEQAAVVLFGADALVERPMSGLAELAPVTSLPQSLHTDLAEAIRLGLALFPAGSARRIVLMSDGAATLGDSLDAAELAASAGVPLDIVPLGRQTSSAEVILRDVRAPTRVREGESFTLDVSVESTLATPAELQVLADGTLVYQDDVRLQPGANNYVVRLQAAEQRFARYAVQVVAVNDEFYQNNRLAVFTRIDGSPRVLLIAGQDQPVEDSGSAQAQPNDAWQQLQLALRAADLVVERVTPGQLPADLEMLSDYDSIVLVDVNAKSLSQRKMAALESYVRDLGGGVVVVGGPESYGMGGYFRTPLEALLPVEIQIKDQERFPAVAMALVIDRSGSMAALEGGLSKIQLAAEGAARTVELLNDFDEITILPVDTAPDEVIGPVSAADRGQIIGQIRQLGAGGGGIYVRTGLEAASAALAQSQNQIKHVILLADGADSEQKDGVPELIAAMTAQGTTVSTVSIGDGPDVPWLRQMAELGGGRFHLTDRAANLPQIFTQETTAIQRSYLVEDRFFPAVGSSPFASQHPILRAMARAGITRVPPLYGYVGTAPKQTAQMLLATHLGDPLLSAWEYGLGRSVAWTSDATGRWAVDWVRWQGFPAFWSNLVRWSIGESSAGNLEMDVRFSDEEAVLTVDARDGDGALLNELALAAVIVDPEGVTSELPLSQIAPGRYEASFLPSAEGAYLIRIASEVDGEGQGVGQTGGWVLGYSPEYRSLEGDDQLLNAMAELTGGRDLSTHFEQRDFQTVLTHDLPAATSSRPIWPWLLILAVLLLPVDIATRRIAINRADLRRAYQATLGRIWQPAAPPARSERVARLFQAKARAATDLGDEVSGETLPSALAKRVDERSQVGADALGDEPDMRPSESEAEVDGPAGEHHESLAARLLERRRRSDQDASGESG